MDTRVPDSRNGVTLPGAINIPHDQVLARKDDLDTARVHILLCNGPQCPQTPDALRTLSKAGCPLDRLAYYRGGMHDWITLAMPTQPTSASPTSTCEKCRSRTQSRRRPEATPEVDRDDACTMPGQTDRGSASLRSLPATGGPSCSWPPARRWSPHAAGADRGPSAGSGWRPGDADPERWPYPPAMDRSAAWVVLALGTLVLVGDVVDIVNGFRDDDPPALLPRLLIALLVVLAMRGAWRKLRAAHLDEVPARRW